MYPPTTKENGGAGNNNLFAGISLHYFYGIKSILLLSRYIRKHEYVSFYQSCTGLFPCLLFTFPCVYLLIYLFIYHVYWLRFPVLSLSQTGFPLPILHSLFLLLHFSFFINLTHVCIYFHHVSFHLSFYYGVPSSPFPSLPFPSPTPSLLLLIPFFMNLTHTYSYFHRASFHLSFSLRPSIATLSTRHTLEMNYA